VQSASEARKVAKYKRIMLKVSGEALQGSKGFGLDPAVVEAIALEIKAAHQHGIQVAVVVGGGNYFRGASAWSGLERATADYVGMLATVMNALCLQVSTKGGVGAVRQRSWLSYISVRHGLARVASNVASKDSRAGSRPCAQQDH
jgi:uridylate kinase